MAGFWELAKLFLFSRKQAKARLDFLVIGLGNPGEKYEGTRHNIGFEVVQKFLVEGQFPPLKVFGNMLVSEKKTPEGLVLLVLPQTYMNDSGEVFKSLAFKYEFAKEEVLVVHDDMDLPLGELRYRMKGSSGGHNGLKSIEACLGTSEYGRLKFGIGRGKVAVLEHVLGHWNEEERLVVDKKIEEAVKALLFWVQNKDKRELINSSFNRN